MKHDDTIKQITENAIANLKAALEAGDSASLTAYLAAMARFHRYSFGNVMLIFAQKPDATRVAGFHTWKKLGRSVRKGEKGLLIIAPMTIRKKADDETTDGEDKVFVRYRGVHVFDISQTDGEPLPEFERATGNPGDAADRLRAFASSRAIAVETAAHLGGADGVSTGGKIILRMGLSPAEECSVLAHELAHELLHHGEDRPACKTVRELEAETVAFIVGQAVGLVNQSASADYIRLYKGDAEQLVASLDRIQRTAAALIAAFSMSTAESSAAPA